MRRAGYLATLAGAATSTAPLLRPRRGLFRHEATPEATARVGLPAVSRPTAPQRTVPEPTVPQPTLPIPQQSDPGRSPAPATGQPAVQAIAPTRASPHDPSRPRPRRGPTKALNRRRAANLPRTASPGPCDRRSPPTAPNRPGRPRAWTAARRYRPSPGPPTARPRESIRAIMRSARRTTAPAGRRARADCRRPQWRAPSTAHGKRSRLTPPRLNPPSPRLNPPLRCQTGRPPRRMPLPRCPRRRRGEAPSTQRQRCRESPSRSRANIGRRPSDRFPRRRSRRRRRRRPSCLPPKTFGQPKRVARTLRQPRPTASLRRRLRPSPKSQAIPSGTHGRRRHPASPPRRSFHSEPVPSRRGHAVHMPLRRAASRCFTSGRSRSRSSRRPRWRRSRPAHPPGARPLRRTPPPTREGGWELRRGSGR